MKTTIRNLMVLALLAMVNYSFIGSESFSGNSFSNWGKYTINKAETNMDFNSNSLETWVVKYDNISSPVYIGICNAQKKCTNFVVTVNGFEVQYKCSDKGFGVMCCDSKFSNAQQTVNADMVSSNTLGIYNEVVKPKIVTEMMLNKENFARQQKICEGQKSQSECLHIIASYLPQLVKGDVEI